MITPRRSLIAVLSVPILAAMLWFLYGSRGRIAGRLLSCARATPAEHQQRLAPVRVGPRRLLLKPPAPARIVFDSEAVETLRDAAQHKSAAFSALMERCELKANTPAPGGYQAFNWANSIADLSLCFHGTGNPRFADAGVRYVAALLDDRFRVGDAQGGARVVQHDAGYGIRTYGTYAALGYDWLRDAPAMTPQLRAKIVERLEAWLGWYEESGYLRDEPIANYFWGYFTALTFAGLAVGDEAPQGRRWLDKAHALLEARVLPVFAAKLRGGDWPEGWQYGEFVTFQAALMVEAYRTAAGVHLAPSLPWLADVVEHHVHALLPDGRSVYSGGTWDKRPSPPSALGLFGVSLALRHTHPNAAGAARFMAERMLPQLEREFGFVPLLTFRKGLVPFDPRVGRTPSHHIAGSGLSLMRSDWSANAVFTSLKIGPRLAPDHQHKDDGHFEFWRGSDMLLTDAGAREGAATINHNCLLIDDGGRLLTYSPNQAVWGKSSRTTHFADDGRVVVAAGSYADSYAPACVRENCRERAVEEAVRTLVFVRPDLLVVADHVELTSADDGVAFSLHLPVEPRRLDAGVAAVVGASRVEVVPLRGTERTVIVREPTASGSGVHRSNDVWGPFFRVELWSPRGSRRRQFTNWILAEGADEHSARPKSVRGEGLYGVHGVRPLGNVAVLFAEGDAHTARALLPAATPVVVVAGLSSGQTYEIAASKTRAGCEIVLRRSRGPGLRANEGGFVRTSACVRE